MIALGFLLAAVGIDVVNGQERFTFGFINLTAGIDLLAVVIGLFGVSEILANVEELTKNTVIRHRIRGLWPTRATGGVFNPMLRGSGLGFFLGSSGRRSRDGLVHVLCLEQRLSSVAERFGKGAIEGVAGPEVGEQRGGGRQHDPGALARHPG